MSPESTSSSQGGRSTPVAPIVTSLRSMHHDLMQGAMYSFAEDPAWDVSGVAAEVIDRLLTALEDIAAVEPFSGTSRLDVTDWADALDKAQRIARDAVEDMS